jgi:FkbM family methyltransferase
MKKEQIISILNKAYFSDAPDEGMILRHFPELLADARSFVDLGASLGQFTKLASELMRDADILAVEADPLRFDELQKNAARWSNSSGNRVRALHAAVSNQPGKLAFQVTNSCVSGGLFQHELRHLDPRLRAEVQWEEVQVDAVTLDDLFPGPPPSFIKMDIEGAEYLALQGASRILQRGQTQWLIELHDFALTDGKPTSDLVIALMHSHGYRCVELDRAGRCLFLRNPWAVVPNLACRALGFRAYRALRKTAKRLLRRS